MKLPGFFLLGACALLVQAAPAAAQQQGAPTLLPMPQYVAAARNQYVTPVGRRVVDPIQAPLPSAEAQEIPQYDYLPGEHGSVYEEALGNDCYDGGCSGSLPCACGPRWFAGAYGLYMTRDRQNPVWTSYDSNDPYGAVLGSPDAAMDWEAGAEIRFGYIFGNDTMLEFVYWGIFDSVQDAGIAASSLGGGMLNSVIDFADLDYDDGIGGTANVNGWYNDAQAHRIRRSFEIHNLELNLLHMPLVGAAGCNTGCASCCNTCCRRGLSVGWGVGIRYLMIDEGFQFGTSEDNEVFGDSDDELYYNIDIQNSLVGFQTGGRADYWWTNHFGVFSDVKFGVYNNHITHHSSVSGNRGYATANNGPNSGEAFNIHSSKDDVAFVGEWRAGVNWQLTNHWRAVAAYRAVALTGVALPGEQIPAFFGDYSGVGNIDSNGSMILHGAQLGLECMW
jgi:hypothetical protein